MIWLRNLIYSFLEGKHCTSNCEKQNQRNTKTHTSHIALLTSLIVNLNVVIGNGGSTVLMFTLHFSLLHAKLIPSQALMLELRDCWEMWYLRYANYSFHVSVIHILKSHFWRTPCPILVNALVGSFTLSQLYLYPNRYGVVVLVGLMFATIICYIHEFVTYN